MSLPKVSCSSKKSPCTTDHFPAGCGSSDDRYAVAADMPSQKAKNQAQSSMWYGYIWIAWQFYGCVPSATPVGAMSRPIASRSAHQHKFKICTQSVYKNGGEERVGHSLGEQTLRTQSTGVAILRGLMLHICGYWGETQRTWRSKGGHVIATTTAGHQRTAFRNQACHVVMGDQCTSGYVGLLSYDR